MTVHQAKLDALGFARAVSEGHFAQAGEAIWKLDLAEKQQLLTAAVVLLSNTLDALAAATDMQPANLYDRLILTANLETGETR